MLAQVTLTEAMESCRRARFEAEQRVLEATRDPLNVQLARQQADTGPSWCFSCTCSIIAVYVLTPRLHLKYAFVLFSAKAEREIEVLKTDIRTAVKRAATAEVRISLLCCGCGMRTCGRAGWPQTDVQVWHDGCCWLADQGLAAQYSAQAIELEEQRAKLDAKFTAVETKAQETIQKVQVWIAAAASLFMCPCS